MIMAFYRGTIKGHLEHDEVFNFTIHFRAVTGQVASMATDLADAVTLLWSGTNSPAGNITALYAPAIGVDDVQVDELGVNARNVAQAHAALSLVGTGTGESLPPQNAVVVSLRTLLPTKAGRGRFYLPSPVVSTVVDQKLDSAAQTDMLNGALAMLNHMKGLSWTPIVFHRPPKNSFETGDSDDVVSIDVGDVFDNQRRRRNQLTEIRVRANLT
jgi:hypothetical protein